MKSVLGISFIAACLALASIILGILIHTNVLCHTAGKCTDACPAGSRYNSDRNECISEGEASPHILLEGPPIAPPRKAENSPPIAPPRKEEDDKDSYLCVDYPSYYTCNENSTCKWVPNTACRERWTWAAVGLGILAALLALAAGIIVARRKKKQAPAAVNL